MKRKMHMASPAKDKVAVKDAGKEVMKPIKGKKSEPDTKPARKGSDSPLVRKLQNRAL